MSNRNPVIRVGELRPTQMLFTYGVGSVIDLPNLSVMVMGLDDWDEARCHQLTEERLLEAVQSRLGPTVQRLLAPPWLEDSGTSFDPFAEEARVGAPVAPFPRWLVCSYCRKLAPVSQGDFVLKEDRYRPENTRFIHPFCSKRGRPPSAFPARFLMACSRGHLDDFPWLFYVHRGPSNCAGPLKLFELGPSGEARDVLVKCEGCSLPSRSMAEAFGDRGIGNLPRCRGRRVHLRDCEPEGCPPGSTPRTMLIGASNSWFPASLSVLSIPVSGNEVEQLVHELWAHLEHAPTREILDAFLKLPTLRRLAIHDPGEIWSAVEKKRNPVQEDEDDTIDLKGPEWQVFVRPSKASRATDFLIEEVAPPSEFSSWLERVVLVERLREVRALTGFTRVDAPGDIRNEHDEDVPNLAPLSRTSPRWVLASEVRGEGLFLQLREEVIARWLSLDSVRQRESQFLTAHMNWNRACGRSPVDAGFPGIRFVLLHSFSHALMRQLSLECGYSGASIRERLYARDAGEPGGPMAGVLLYTAAPDSEGTLGGLVSLGRPKELGRHLRGALDQATLCASDPLCSEHRPDLDRRSLHAAACHACMFAPETSCERGNRYLDRSTIVHTVDTQEIGLFARLASLT